MWVWLFHSTLFVHSSLSNRIKPNNTDKPLGFIFKMLINSILKDYLTCDKYSQLKHSTRGQIALITIYKNRTYSEKHNKDPH